MNETIHQESKHRVLVQQATLNALEYQPKRLFDKKQSINPFTDTTQDFLHRARRYPGESFSPTHVIGDTRQLGFVTRGGAGEGMMAIGLPRQNEEEAILRVARRYTYIKSEEVKTFLMAHPGVARTLLDAVPAIEKVFGRSVTLTLQVLVDQDGENDVSLFTRIQTPNPVREAISLRKQFYREWWMKQAQALKSPLNFEVESI